MHKYRLNELSKALSYNPNFVSGIGVAGYYFKKYESDSLFQLSDKGDFIAVQYLDGLNPALYAAEFTIMSKIVFTISGTSK